jgi:hypothetical protein
MALPELRQLILEDFPSEAAWIEKLLRPLNGFMASVANAFKATLMHGQNVQTEQVTIQTDASAVANSFPLFFEVKMAVRPQTVVVGFIKDETAESTFTTAVTPTWDLVGSRVRIRHLTGLTTSKKYTVRFRAEGR